MASKEIKNQNSEWWTEQFNKLKVVFSLLIAILLNSIVILCLWEIRQLLILVIGIDPAQIKDKTLYWIIRISEISTLISVLIFIIADIIKHLLFTYKDVERSIIDTLFLKTRKAIGAKS